MRDVVTYAVRIAAGAVLVTLLMAVTHPTASDPTEGAVLRIALRTTAGTMQDCRRLSQQELDALPMHMRRPEVCETRAVPYRLEASIDGRALLDRTYTAAGYHGDRPLVVGDEVPVPPGTHDVTIHFAPEVEGGANPPPSFTFTGAVEFAEGRIRVATLNAAGTDFEIR